MIRHGLGILTLVLGGIVGIAGGRMAIDWFYSSREDRAEWMEALPEGFTEWNADLSAAMGSLNFGSELNDVLNNLYSTAPNEYSAWMDAKVAMPPAEFAAWQEAVSLLHNAASEEWKRWENALVAWQTAPNEENESEMIDAYIAIEAVAPQLLEEYVTVDTILAEDWPAESAAYSAATQELMKAAPQEFAAVAALQLRAYEDAGE